MYVTTQSLAHLPSADICDGMQRQAIEQLIVTLQILPDTVDYQVKQLMLFMQEQGNSQVSNLLLTILIRTDQIDSLKMSKVDIPSEYVDVQQFAHILLLVVPVQVSILKLLPDVCQLFIDPLFL